jgi:hypothetical protein
MYGDVITFAGCPESLMMWCMKILARDVDMEDGIWHAVDGPGLCSFIYTSGQCYLEV